MYLYTDSISSKISHISMISEKKIQESTQRLSTGLRINSASDDVAGLAISTRLQSQTQNQNQLTKNLQDSYSFLQTSDGTLSSLEEQLQKIRELTIQLQNGTNSTNDKQNILNQIQDILHSIDQTSSSSTFNGIPLFSASSSLYTDGINDMAKTSSTSSLNALKGNTPFSIEAWVNPNGTSTQTSPKPVTVNRWLSPTNNGGFYLQVNNNGNTQFGIFNNANYSVATTINMNQWTHLMGVYDGKNMNFYVNGTLVGSTVCSVGIGDHTGMPLLLSAPAFGGNIDDVRIYSSALTLDEVANNFSGLTTEKNLLYEYDFNTNSVNQTNDNGGNTPLTLLSGASVSSPGVTIESYLTDGMYFNQRTINSQTLGLSNFDPNSSNSIQQVDNALSTVTNQRVKTGIEMNQVQERINQYSNSSIQLADAKKRISDSDTAEASSTLLKEELKLQAQYSIIKKNNQYRENYVSMLIQ